MSAWAALVNSDGSDEHLKLCEEALMEIQHVERTQCLRHIAEEVLQMNAEGFSALDVWVVLDSARVINSHRGDLPFLREAIRVSKEAYKP